MSVTEVIQFLKYYCTIYGFFLTLTASMAFCATGLIKINIPIILNWLN